MESSGSKPSPDRAVPLAPRCWLLLAAVALIAGGIATVFWFAGHRNPGAAPLDGTLTVLVRPPDRKLEPVPVEQPGAVPVQSGGAMFLDAQLNQPAFMYFVWLDSEGQVLPLYPWNNEILEIKDINESPPVRRAGKLVFSPLLGHSWTFSTRAGMETVLLLARRTPLPPEIKLGSLIASPQRYPSANLSEQSVESNKAVVFLKSTARSSDVTVVQDGKKLADVVTFTEEPLLSILTRLHAHFELIHAVRFPHQGPAAESERNSSSPPAIR
jgi:hypothetical protein